MTKERRSFEWKKIFSVSLITVIFGCGSFYALTNFRLNNVEACVPKLNSTINRVCIIEESMKNSTNEIQNINHNINKLDNKIDKILFIMTEKRGD